VIAYSVRSATALRGAATPAVESDSGQERPSIEDRILWVSLAACGSLLLSAVTNHISQNVATIPLFWIIPLVAYC